MYSPAARPPSCSRRSQRARRYLALLAAGYTYHEISEREGVTYTNVNKHLARASRRGRALREGGETPYSGA